MKIRRFLAFALAFVMALPLVSALPALAAPIAADTLVLPAKPTAAFSVKVDGKPLSVNAWEAIPYVAKPTAIHFAFPAFPKPVETSQLLNIYAPASVKADSPVILFVENSGWFLNAAPVRLKEGSELPANTTVSNQAAMGEALKAGYVIVTYACRGRLDSPDNGQYTAHSPATMVDTKAVIRYLRHNDAVIPGDSEKIVVTGTSGGGALSSVIAASGNSPDFYPFLYEIGAAGMRSASESTISDAVFAAIAYCPITDLGNADAAYEWIYGDTRKAIKDYAAAYALPEGSPYFDKAAQNSVFHPAVLAASAELAPAYAAYIDGLGLKLEDGTPLNAANFRGAIKALLEKGVEQALREGKNLNADLASPTGVTQFYNSTSKGWKPWFTLADNGKATIDWDAFLLFVALNEKLKMAPAFSNVGSATKQYAFKDRDEDNLFGTKDQPYSPFEFWAWNNNIEAGNGVGKDDTGLDWNAHIRTEAGKALLGQIKMTNAIAYLTSAAEGMSAPHWYVRHGIRDRDTAFAVEALLYYALKNDASVKNVDFNFAWLKAHSGNYDVPEAYAWLARVLKAK